MHRYILLLAFVMSLPVLYISCEDGIYTGSVCSHCTTQKPSEGKVHLRFTLDDQQPRVPFIIYEGKGSGGVTVLRDTAETDLFAVFLEVEKDYTAEAIYKRDGKVIHAFDGGDIRVRKSECDEVECYYTRVLKLDLELIRH